MDNLPFKPQETLALWQWLVLLGFCVFLVAAAVVARIYGKRGNSGKLFDALNLKQPAQSLQDVDFQQKVLSRSAKLYYLKIDGKQHLIFETDKGLIALDNESNKLGENS